MSILVQLLHGLAYVGVYLLNLLIYETIGVIIWSLVAYVLFGSKRIPEAEADRMTDIFALVLCIAISVMLVLMLFGKGYIVPLPNFS
jgi:hypothetical protein